MTDDGRRPDFRSLFECVPGLYLALTPDLKIVAVSDAYLRATMTVRDQIVGRGIFDVFPDNPDDPGASGVQNLRASLDRALRHKRADDMAIQKYDIRRPDADGGGFEERHWSPVNSPVLGADSEVRYIIHRVEDVTEFVKLQQAGRERDRESQAYRIRAEQMESEVFLRSQELSKANHQLRTVNGELERLYSQISELMTTAEKELPGKAARPEGPPPEKGAHGPAEMLARVGRLIEGHKRIEEQLRQAQKMEAIGRLAGGVAHDFNNLLTVIAGYSDLLANGLAEGPHANAAREIGHAASRASALTKQLLAFSRKQILQPQVLDLNTVVSGMEGMLRRLIGENIALVIVLGSTVGKVLADPNQMELVIMNLAVNARDAMPGGGRLIIETRPSGPETDPGSNGIPHAMLMVSDTGQGMDRETMERIFEPFFTTKRFGAGTGLGLSTVQGIIEQSGGRVTVESRPGQGTAFRVYLPVTGTATGRTAAPEREMAAGVRGTIMVLEDDPALRKLLVTVLKSAGYQVFETASGQEALLLTERLGQIDILLSDVVMPGLSGPEVVKKIRGARTNLKVLFISGYDADMMSRALPEGNTHFLPKPFTPEDLLSKVGGLLSRAG